MNPIVYVDVDDTLIRSFGSRRIAMSHTVERVRELREAGVPLYRWSSGGGEYAGESAREVGLEHCFIAFLPKPQALIDDVPVQRWRLVELHPNEAATVTSSELAERVRSRQ
ncbi:MAG: hypothetical protein KC656_10620 [Myxococcales bacterium]|nr:hypothetical protein [Myxococcales bacterium]